MTFARSSVVAPMARNERWHEPNTFFSRYSLRVLLASILVLAVGVWQNVITRRIDYHVVNRCDE